MFINSLVYRSINWWLLNRFLLIVLLWTMVHFLTEIWFKTESLVEVLGQLDELWIWTDFSHHGFLVFMVRNLEAQSFCVSTETQNHHRFMFWKLQYQKPQQSGFWPNPETMLFLCLYNLMNLKQTRGWHGNQIHAKLIQNMDQMFDQVSTLFISELCDWQFVSEMHPGSHSWLLCCGFWVSTRADWRKTTFVLLMNLLNIDQISTDTERSRVQN